MDWLATIGVWLLYGIAVVTTLSFLGIILLAMSFGVQHVWSHINQSRIVARFVALKGVPNSPTYSAGHLFIDEEQGRWWWTTREEQVILPMLVATRRSLAWLEPEHHLEDFIVIIDEDKTFVGIDEEMKSRFDEEIITAVFRLATSGQLQCAACPERLENEQMRFLTGITATPEHIGEPAWGARKHAQ